MLLTGATGYVGGRLLRLFEERGARLRCLARRARVLSPRVAPSTDVVEGDLLDPATLGPALRRCRHRLLPRALHGRGPRLRGTRPSSGAPLRAGRARGGVRRIVYLGGLGRGDDLSPHLRSRHEVGRILLESGARSSSCAPRS
ncbi:MAG: NAD(P)H-binding protein [Planctomycetota bacterium]